MAAKPIVDGIEQEHGEALQVVRLNIQETVAQVVAEHFDYQFTPTFILFDSSGKELFRSVGSIDPVQVRQALSGN